MLQLSTNKLNLLNLGYFPYFISLNSSITVKLFIFKFHIFEKCQYTGMSCHKADHKADPGGRESHVNLLKTYLGAHIICDTPPPSIVSEIIIVGTVAVPVLLSKQNYR